MHLFVHNLAQREPALELEVDAIPAAAVKTESVTDEEDETATSSEDEGSSSEEAESPPKKRRRRATGTVL